MKLFLSYFVNPDAVNDQVFDIIFNKFNKLLSSLLNAIYIFWLQSIPVKHNKFVDNSKKNDV